jgi:transposase
MHCVKCGSEALRKNGIVHSRQRYLCKAWGYNLTVEQKSTAFAKSIKEQALQMYLEGMGFRAIGRVLGMSHVSVYRLIRAFGERTLPLASRQAVDVVEMDELHTYIGNKKPTVGSGLL